MFKIATTTLFALSAITLAVPAAAQPEQNDVTVEIRLDGLDLTRAEDRDRLDDRVEYAIRRACRVNGMDSHSRKTQRACQESMTDLLAPQVELAIAEARGPSLAAIEANPGA
ncbi:UrcA family protein [Aurantiacibacter zhengii]|uniref:UrcA family protein n=1 Tax=Aurantiacibacter zhengii TaxID=2307003 RepID=A0A418NW29_9SPHN|nr:UrcA family protein [Aurantiacibacter zhengii]RIV88821.1 UrcA family protein [Aurantiacibacter zhengii]